MSAWDMNEELRAAWAAARAAWPGIEVAEADFAAFVADRSESASLQTLRTSDLYVACACARGDGAAIAAFERAFFVEVDTALKRKGGSSAPPLDEVRQLVRHKLFVAEGGGRPKIAEYSGRGELRSWVRVTVTRFVLNLSTRAGPEVPFAEDALMFLLGGTEDPELEYVKRAYSEHFRASFGEALAGLGTAERMLLRYAFVDGLTVDAIGGILGVHRATAARRIVAAHRSLLERVRASLTERLDIPADEYSKVLRLIQSRIELSLERYLETPKV